MRIRQSDNNTHIICNIVFFAVHFTFCPNAELVKKFEREIKTYASCYRQIYNPLFVCLFVFSQDLFGQLQFSHERALPPDALRKALAQSFSDQHRFQLGFMDDAAECFVSGSIMSKMS